MLAAMMAAACAVAPPVAQAQLASSAPVVADCGFNDDCQRSGSDCGFSVDCPRTYQAGAVNASVTDHGVSAEEATQAHELARAECAGRTHSAVLETGGWCYDTDEARRVNGRSGSSYLIPMFHDTPDDGVVSVIVGLLGQSKAAPLSLVDLGAGVGTYGRALSERLPGLRYTGYDGAGNVEAFTDGYVNFADLTMRWPTIQRSEWAISLEVGEHIHHEKEVVFVRNLHAANCRGIVLSWGVLDQPGHGHINCHSNDYLTRLMTELGYRLNTNLTSTIRTNAQHWWFQKSAMVFERLSRPAECGPATVDVAMKARVHVS